MKWQTLQITPPRNTNNIYRYLKDVESVQVNEENEWYCHNDGWTAGNTEIYVDKGKSTLLITVGDSCTYGEGVDPISHRQHRWDIHDRIEKTYSGKIARILDSDLWTFALPGNSNSGMFTALFRILDNVPVGRYKKIKVLLQLTSGDRDVSYMLPDDHPIQPLINLARTNIVKIPMEQWFINYDNIWFDLLDQQIAKHTGLNLDVVVFKALNKIWTPRRDFKFKLIETSWIKFNAAWNGVDLTEFYCGHPQFYEEALSSKFIIDNLNFKNQDLDRWEKCVNFLHVNSDTCRADHPSEYSHGLWTQFLLNQTGWNQFI